jgi:DNA-binding NtrC family response regulator
VGVLYVDAHDPAHAFGNALRQFFDLFAAQAAAALKNAWEHRAKRRALETAEETIRRHRTASERRDRLEGMIGSCDAMQEVYRKLDQVVPTELPVMVLGETGTGKELAARLIHSRGPRREKEFVATNCAGVPESLLESELFGHERGAFTGADRARAGLFEIAHRGTLFLDEVGDMSPRMQASLLRVLQSGEVRRLGGRATVIVDVRIIAATHRDLEALVERDEFRQDLYFRLNVLSLRLPALRERADDIPVLARELMAGMISDRPAPSFSVMAMRRLVAYSWPGNVRELQNVLRRLAILGTDLLEEEHLPAEILQGGARPGRVGTLKTAEAVAIRRALESTRGNKVKAAKMLGVDRKTLYKKLRRAGSARGVDQEPAADDLKR